MESKAGAPETLRRKVYDRILVPLDGSGMAEAALPYVRELAVKLGSRFFLLSACTPGDPLERPFQAYLDKTASQLQEEGLDVTGLCVFGDVAASILDFADECRIGLIVISTHGSTGTGYWPLGSIANKVIRSSRMPVLLIRPKELERRTEIALDRVLMPLDGSQFAEQIMPYALELVKDGGEVVLLRVIEPVHVPGAPVYKPGMDYSLEYKTGIEREAGRYLSHVSAAIAEKGFRASSTLLVGKPAETILDFAEEKGVDLIALSTHGFSGITKWAFGSVASKLIDGSSLPLLLVRPPLPTAP